MANITTAAFLNIYDKLSSLLETCRQELFELLVRDVEGNYTRGSGHFSFNVLFHKEDGLSALGMESKQ